MVLYSILALPNSSIFWQIRASEELSVFNVAVYSDIILVIMMVLYAIKYYHLVFYTRIICIPIFIHLF